MTDKKLKDMIKEEVALALKEVRPEEFGVKDWGSDGLHDQESIVRWARDTKERLESIVNDRNNQLDSRHRAQLMSLASKIVHAVRKAHALGIDDYRKRI